MAHTVKEVTLEMLLGDIDDDLNNSYFVLRKVENVAEAAKILLNVWENNGPENLRAFIVNYTPVAPLQNENGVMNNGIIWASQQQQAVMLVAGDDDTQWALMRQLNDDKLLDRTPLAMVNYLQDGATSLILGDAIVPDDSSVDSISDTDVN